MASGYSGSDLSEWYRATNLVVECRDGCGRLDRVSTRTLADALRIARAHAARTGHTVRRTIVRYQLVRPKGERS